MRLAPGAERLGFPELLLAADFQFSGTWYPAFGTHQMFDESRGVVHN